MLKRVKKRHLLAAAAVIVFSLVAVLIYPGWRSDGPPPETIGNDVVKSSGADFLTGQMEGTGVASSTGGTDVVTLAPAHPQGSYTSEPVKTDYPFNALGLHWLAQVPDGANLSAEVRFSQDGTQWGEWKKVSVDGWEVPDHISVTKSAGETIGELVFADKAKFFQYRFELLRNAAGQAPQLERITASYIDAKGFHEQSFLLAAAMQHVAWFFKTQQAKAEPGVISRAQWGANEQYMTWDPEYEFPKKMIIHHTVTSNYDPDPAATVRSIYYYHAVSLGWGDIGYNYLIDWRGNVYEGRYGGNGVIGGHALGWNEGTIGIAALGNYDEVTVSSAMYNAFVWLMTNKANANQIDPWGATPMNGTTLPNIIGHRDTYSTACPGEYLYAQIPSLRNDVHAGYEPIPVIGAIRDKWQNVLHGAPGAPLNVEYDVPGGRAQDFQVGRLMYNASNYQVYWVMGGIQQKFDSLGGVSSFLGWPTSDEYDVGSGRGQDFVGGKIYWHIQTGAHSINGAIMNRYLAEGGALRWGFPVSDEFDVPGYPGWRESDFQLLRIFWSSGTGTLETFGAINQKYTLLGGPAIFGPPSGEEHDIPGVSGGRESTFVNGRIIWTPTTGAYALAGPISDKYTATGGPTGYHGLPISDEYYAGSGRAQNFQRSIITYNSSLGAHEVIGAIMGKYQARGGPGGYFGLAATDEIDAPGVAGARESDFERGRIYWTPSYGAREVYGAILAKFVEKGGSAAMGVPVTDEYDIPGVAGGRESDFTRGSIYWHPNIGANEVYGAILGLYLSWGGPSGYLGMPVSGEIDAPGVAGARESDFEHGRIYWSNFAGSHAVIGAILAKYLEYGGSASDLGIPISDEYAYGNGRRSDFMGGYIYWDPWSGASVHTGTATTVTSDAAFEVRDSAGTLLTTVAAGHVASVTYASGTYFVQTDAGYYHSGSNYIRMAGSGIMQVTSYHDIPPWNPSLDDNRFRGTIEVRYSPLSNAVWVINELPLEYYLRGVAETSAGSPSEYLKTMTVAARSYALWHLNNGGKYGSSEIFHLKNSRNGNGDDQQYKGYGLEARFPDLVAAVTSTAGQVVTYSSNVAITPYFSNSDGRTRSAQEVWGITYWPWLQSVADPDCNGMTLNGHGVGLSGYGALKRAERGDSYQAILTYYYNDTAIQTADTNKVIRVAIMQVP